MQTTKEIDPFSLFLFSLKAKEGRLKYAQRINRIKASNGLQSFHLY